MSPPLPQAFPTRELTPADILSPFWGTLAHDSDGPARKARPLSGSGSLASLLPERPLTGRRNGDSLFLSIKSEPRVSDSGNRRGRARCLPYRSDRW